PQELFHVERMERMRHQTTPPQSPRVQIRGGLEDQVLFHERHQLLQGSADSIGQMGQVRFAQLPGAGWNKSRRAEDLSRLILFAFGPAGVEKLDENGPQLRVAV